MYKVIINWYDNYCQIDEDSDFYEDIFRLTGPIYQASKEDVEAKIYNLLSNLKGNHYGKLEEQTQILHKFLI